MQDIQQIIEELSFEKKVSLLSGKDLWHTVDIDHLDIPHFEFRMALMASVVHLEILNPHQPALRLVLRLVQLGTRTLSGMLARLLEKKQ